MKKYIVFLICLFLFSCQNKESKIVPQHIQDTVDLKKQEKKIKKQEDTLYLKPIKKKEILTVNCELDSLQPRVYLKFDTNDLGILNVSITPTTGKGNIRLNQIIFPDNTSDGPFGMESKINLQTKGKHILAIGHSQMADNPFFGKFNVQLQITNEE